MKIILIPNYRIIFTTDSKLKLKQFLNYSITISFSYYLKTKDKFYNQFSLISYNPYMFPKYFSNIKKYKNCRKSFFYKYNIIYKIINNQIKILDIFHYRSNYKKVN